MLPKVCAWITVITFTKIYCILPIHSNVTIKNVSWPHFSWPTLYVVCACWRFICFHLGWKWYYAFYFTQCRFTDWLIIRRRYSWFIIHFLLWTDSAGVQPVTEDAPPSPSPPINMAVHHLHHLHHHHFHLLLLVQSFILTLRLGSLANRFHHGLFPNLPDWLYGFCILNILLNGWICLHGVLD